MPFGMAGCIWMIRSRQALMQKSMGGSQVYLEEGETQNAETMIKCIVIASGNDASVAMAEHLAGD